MKKLIIGTALWTCTIAATGAQTFEAAAPPPIPIDGVVTDELGQALTGVVNVIFALYQEHAGGAPLWVEIQAVQPDAAGQYFALLGATTPLPVDLFASRDARWLGVQPEGQAEQPRIRFLSVPYALKAGDADTLGGVPLREFVLLGGAGSASLGNASSSFTTAFDPSHALESLQTIDDDLTVTGNLLVQGNGPHGIGSLDSHRAFQFTPVFIGQSGDATEGTRWAPTITGVPNEGAYLNRYQGVINTANSGTHEIAASLLVQAPTININGATVTTAASLAVIGPPSGGGTNFALWVQNGPSRIEGAVGVGGTVTAPAFVGDGSGLTQVTAVYAP